MMHPIWVKVVSLSSILTLFACAVREEKAAAPAKAASVVEAKAPAEKTPPVKAKPIKAKGDVGLLDLEKNYLILVTKEGKLIPLEFSEKTKATKITPTESKVEDIGLGASVSVEYQTQGDKKVATKVEYKAAKGGE
jgi:hypothetical protein